MKMSKQPNLFAYPLLDQVNKLILRNSKDGKTLNLVDKTNSCSSEGRTHTNVHTSLRI